jgi:hypothetical protein
MSVYDCLGGDDDDGSQTAYMPVRVTRDNEVGSGQEGDLLSMRSSGSKKIDSDEYNREWAKYQPKGPTDQRVGPLAAQVRKLQTMCEALEDRVRALEMKNGPMSSQSHSRARGRGKQTTSSAWKALNG